MTGVILFRAQPFHNGHMYMVQKAYNDCRKMNCDLYVFIGSADKCGTKRNPLPIELREYIVTDTIWKAYNGEDRDHIHIVSLNDLSDEANNTHDWGKYLYTHIVNNTNDREITIYYSDKPEIMLSWFDDDIREHISFKFLKRYDGICATDVRQAFLNNDKTKVLDTVPYVVSKNYYDEIRKYIVKAYME